MPDPNSSESSYARTVSELIEQSRAHPIRWLIPGVLLEGGTHILHGKEESFKTMLTLQMHEVLSAGGEFLMRNVAGGLRTGIAELEEKPSLFGHRLSNFFKPTIPEIAILPADLRWQVLSAKDPCARIGTISQWARDNGLQVVSIDSAVKLFPPHYDLSKPEHASEVFNQLQTLPTLWLLAHDRKNLLSTAGNDEIVGSGRFAQDPDVVHQMVRPDKRAPVVEFYWGKMREGEKDAPLKLFFDKREFRLYPVHPYLHLLQRNPMLEEELVSEAEERYGWKERRAREYLASLLDLKDAAAQPAVASVFKAHSKELQLVGRPMPPDWEAEVVSL